MKPNKEHLRTVASQSLIKAGINWTEHNNGYHFKIGHINFYPTTGLWQSDNIGGDKGKGIDSLIRFLQKIHPLVEIKYRDDIKKLSVQQIAKIFLNNTNKSLMEKCEILHKEIYG